MRNVTFDLRFSYRGRSILVTSDMIPDGWTGDSDHEFRVDIDGVETEIPGIWPAYQSDKQRGIELVIKAFLDVR